MVCPMCFKNSRDALLSWSVCPYMINLGIINGCTFLKLKIHVIKFHEMLEFFDIIWLSMLMLKSPNIVVGQEVGIVLKKCRRWFKKVVTGSVEGLYKAII